MKDVIIAICVISVAYGIISHLIKENGTGKMTRFICALCFLISLCSVFSGNLKEFSFDLPASAEIDYTSSCAAAVEAALEEMLKKSGITAEKISVSLYENPDDSISINEITVYGANDVDLCLRLIKENTGLDSEVKVFE